MSTENPLLDNVTTDMPPVPTKGKAKAQRKTSEDKIAELELKQQQLQERIKDEKAKISKQKRKEDTRRKIITGALVLEHMTMDENFRLEIESLIRRHAKDKDRELFDF